VVTPKIATDPEHISKLKPVHSYRTVQPSYSSPSRGSIDHSVAPPDNDIDEILKALETYGAILFNRKSQQKYRTNDISFTVNGYNLPFSSHEYNLRMARSL
jgi:hypothetical protein